MLMISEPSEDGRRGETLIREIARINIQINELRATSFSLSFSLSLSLSSNSARQQEKAKKKKKERQLPPGRTMASGRGRSPSRDGHALGTMLDVSLTWSQQTEETKATARGSQEGEKNGDERKKTRERKREGEEKGEREGERQRGRDRPSRRAAFDISDSRNLKRETTSEKCYFIFI
jgi:hypothetical protein